MSVIARFEVIPVRDGSMSTAISCALDVLDRHPVSYRTTATDTIIEADTVDQLFAAVQAAHEAIPEERVITSLEIDEDRRRQQGMAERVASVERALGHPPERQLRPGGQPPSRSQQGSPPRQQRHAPGRGQPEPVRSPAESRPQQ